MRLPSPRGPLAATLFEVLSGDTEAAGASRLQAAAEQAVAAVGSSDDVLTDEDVQLSLWTMYELHYRGFADVDAGREWDPDLLRVRAVLERPFEAALRRRAEPHVAAVLAAEGDLPTRLFDLAEGFDGPSVASFVQRHATEDQFAELMVHRSVYHLKESDPVSWTIPRIDGAAKAALVELQYDEYGGGRGERLHATMFGDALEACGLDREYGAYVDRVPAYTLASNNAMSLFGLHRRLRGASLGHLGAFEATSSLPCKKFAGGVRRLGLPERAAAYFDEHVEADAVHEQLAFRDVCAAIAAESDAMLRDVVLGAVVCLDLAALTAERMLDGWRNGRSTLRDEGTTLEAVAS
jgi:hypothetical protein